MNLTIQYIIVGIILAAVAVYIVLKLIKLKKTDAPPACAGCALSQTCAKKGKNLNKLNNTKPDCHENNQNME